MSSRKQKQESYISIQHNKFSECIIMLLPSYMPPEHDATAIQHHSIPGKINWLALHASVFRRNSASKKKRYLGVCLVAQVQWRTSCSLTIFGRFRWAAATYSELPVVSEEYLQYNGDINQSLADDTGNQLYHASHTSTYTRFPFMLTHSLFILTNSTTRTS